jgi:hypothetical protein
VTNKRGSPRKIVAFHEGRGAQEGLFAELKSHCQLDYVPVTTRAGNQLYMFAGILAHNLTRELQMQVTPRTRATTAKRATLWCFREIATLRRTLIQRAGRIIRPAGKLILSMNNNESSKTSCCIAWDSSRLSAPDSQEHEFMQQSGKQGRPGRLPL